MDPTAEAAAVEAASFFTNLMAKAVEIGVRVLIALVIIGVAWLLSRWAEKALINAANKRNLDQAMSRFLGTMLRYTLLAAGVIAALAKVGVETTSVIAILGSAGLAVGLALQGSLANFASGVMILFFRPFELGHQINAAGHTGVIEDIGLFATSMVTPDNEKIIIPNSAITGGSIVNYSARGTRRVGIDVGVAYGVDPADLDRVLLPAVAESSMVLQDPAPEIVFANMGASAIEFKVYVWVKWDDWVPVQGDVRARCYAALNAADIEIPYDTIVVHQAAS
jgi:small conductance mechanosensitive channel